MPSSHRSTNSVCSPERGIPPHVSAIGGDACPGCPSPLVNGSAAAWACGVVRTIGWVNFLDDRTRKPHMKMTDVDKAFGVSSGTGQARSMAIRDLLRIRPFDPDWTLPSRMADNPMVWLIQVNGMIVDARAMPREVQEEAFQRGMIPYLPAKGEPNDDC